MSAVDAIVAFGERVTVLPKITCITQRADRLVPPFNIERQEIERATYGGRKRVSPHDPETTAYFRAVDNRGCQFHM